MFQNKMLKDKINLKHQSSWVKKNQNVNQEHWKTAGYSMMGIHLNSKVHYI